jgi:hypothetical protein
MRIWRISLFATGVALAGYFAYRLLAVTDAKRIAGVLEHTRQGVVRRDLELAMSGFDRNYQDDFGHDYTRMSEWFDRVFLRYDSIVCIFSRMRIGVEQNAASCTLDVWGAGYIKSGPGSEIVDGFPVYSDQVVIQLHKFRTGWRIISASP